MTWIQGVAIVLLGIVAVFAVWAVLSKDTLTPEQRMKKRFLSRFMNKDNKRGK